MIGAVSRCWSQVTPKNAAVSAAITSGIVSGVGFGLGFWSVNISLSVVAAITLIFSAFLAGTSFKYIPTGSLENVVNRLNTLPSQFKDLLKGSNGQTLGLEEIVAKLREIDTGEDENAEEFKQILLSAQKHNDQLSKVVEDLKKVNDQYKDLIASFTPFLEKLGFQNKSYVDSARRITSILGHVKTEDLESGPLTKLAQELPRQIEDLQKNLTTLGEQILRSQNETVANTVDLTAKMEENKKLLQEIAEARRALAKAQAEFTEKMRESAAA